MPLLWVSRSIWPLINTPNLHFWGWHFTFPEARVQGNIPAPELSEGCTWTWFFPWKDGNLACTTRLIPLGVSTAPQYDEVLENSPASNFRTQHFQWMAQDKKLTLDIVAVLPSSSLPNATSISSTPKILSQKVSGAASLAPLGLARNLKWFSR